MSVLGAVLAGGRSSRMGQDKAHVLVQQRTMLEMVTDALRQVAGSVVLLGADRAGWECWPDMVHIGGPLAGLTTALTRTTNDQVLAVAVDHPFVRVETLSRILEWGGRLPVVPVDDHGTRQVTCALYPKSIAAVAMEEAAANGSVQSLLDRVSFEALTPEIWRTWGEDGRSWFSADSPEALEEGIALYTSRTDS